MGVKQLFWNFLIFASRCRRTCGVCDEVAEFRVLSPTRLGVISTRACSSDDLFGLMGGCLTVSPYQIDEPLACGSPVTCGGCSSGQTNKPNLVITKSLLYNNCVSTEGPGDAVAILDLQAK